MEEIKSKYRPIEGHDGAIRILDEEFKDIAISLGRVSIDASEEGNYATLKYEYDVIELPDGIEIDEKFETLVGDIVVDIIDTKLENNPNSLRFDDRED